MITWVSAHIVNFNFLLKTDVDTLICFSMVTDMLDAVRQRFGGDDSIYLGHIETCSKIQHNEGDRFYDPFYMQDLLFREDAPCYPPYMQGLGYVLSRNLVQTIAAMAHSLKVYTNEDMMVGTWLVGHKVHRGRLVARQFTEIGYQTTLAECFPLYFNHKIPAFVMRECTHFHVATGLCWEPRVPINPKGRSHVVAATMGLSHQERAGGGVDLHVTGIGMPSRDSPSASKPMRARLLELVTVGIKAVTHLRNHVHFIMHSIHRRYPGIRIIVADDEYVGVAREEWRRLTDLMNDLNVTYVQLVPRVGLSAGRNALVDACQTKYLVLLDDDVFFTAATRLEVLLDILEAQPHVMLVAGSYMQYSSSRGVAETNDYSLLFQESDERGVWRSIPPPSMPTGACQRVHAAHNFFMARTATLRRYPWHPKLSVFEHEHFFFQLHLANQSVFVCPHISVFHYRAPNLIDPRYREHSLRFKEHLFARHFCDAFAHVKVFKAPFWTYDCRKFLLCPQWDLSLPCVPMQNPWQLVQRQTWPVTIPNQTVAPVPANKIKGATSLDGDGSIPLLPQHVLILAEGGTGVELLSQLFARSDHYMLWREPRNWRFSAHMPDNLFGAMLAGLFRCTLSAQQLEMLHSYSPDLLVHNEAEAAEEVEQGEEGDLQKRYSLKGLNSSEPRFCGPGMATAVHVSRFHAGLPAVLQKVPFTKFVMLVRNPVDVVVARVQAKWVRGGPAWPACTLRTIDRCAEELCNSSMLMLRSLPTAANGEDRLRLLRWETFARRKQRVAADLFAWLGATANHTAVAELIEEVDSELRAFKAISDKYPLSPTSMQVVEQRCADVMKSLGYKTTLSVTPRRASVLGNLRSRKRARLGNVTTGVRGELPLRDSQRPVPLLRHTLTPPFAWCPVRLGGAEPITRFFIRRDAPAATAAAFCFPEISGERCPSRQGAKWHRSRWGNYPFETMESAPSTVDVLNSEHHAPLDARPMVDGFSFAFVRNPYDRLVSAYTRHIATQEKSAAVHRAWIREAHRLGDREPISFSHFVRWLAQQDSSVMHRSWQPFSDTCQFATKRYDFVGKLENLPDDFVVLMDALKLDASDRRLWDQVVAKTRPAQPIGGEDRIMQLHHFFLADDAHDLVDVVKRRYAEDLQLFNYSFPMLPTGLTYE